MAKRRLIHSMLSLTLIVGGLACSKKQAETPPPPPPAAKTVLSGYIDLAPEVAKDADPLAVIFVIAKTEDGKIVAAGKLLPPFQFPVHFELTTEDVMIPGTALKGPLVLTARLDKDSNANPPQEGDILGKADQASVPVGASDVKIVLDELVKK